MIVFAGSMIFCFPVILGSMSVLRRSIFFRGGFADNFIFDGLDDTLGAPEVDAAADDAEHNERGHGDFERAGVWNLLAAWEIWVGETGFFFWDWGAAVFCDGESGTRGLVAVGGTDEGGVLDITATKIVANFGAVDDFCPAAAAGVVADIHAVFSDKVVVYGFAICEIVVIEDGAAGNVGEAIWDGIANDDVLLVHGAGVFVADFERDFVAWANFGGAADDRFCDFKIWSVGEDLVGDVAGVFVAAWEEAGENVVAEHGTIAKEIIWADGLTV